jgi:ubiquinone/menaquinone biosynthesis C-methylase UbiE
MEKNMNLRDHNKKAWDVAVKKGSPYTVPVTHETIEAAKKGQWEIRLITKPLPKQWLGSVLEKDVLLLAGGGGQQGPILAAVGARVTVFDNSPLQLAQDRMVAKREGLSIITVEGDMRDLGVFVDESFDIIINPVSNVYIPDVQPVWRESYRVLRHGGLLIAAFDHAEKFVFDYEILEKTGQFEVNHSLPYSDIDLLSESEKEHYRKEGLPFQFSHSLEEQINGQLNTGFILTNLSEDIEDIDLVSRIMPTYITTRAEKP